MRARLGTAVALVVGAVLLALGPAWEHLLWPVEIGFSGAIAAGLGALIALERGDRRGDLLACAALVLSLAFSSLGLVFAVGAAVDVVLRGDERLRRAFVPAVPLALYALWYAVYGQETESAVSVENIYALPAYVWDAASSALASLLGLTRIGTRSGSIGVSPDYARPLLVALLDRGGVARRPPPRGADAVVLGLRRHRARVLGVGRAQSDAGSRAGRQPLPARRGNVHRPHDQRAAARPAPARLGLALLALLGAASIASNLGALRAGEDFFRAQTDVHLAALAALEGARDQVDEAVVLEPTFAGTPFPQTISAGSYFAAVDRWGSPVADPEDALAGPEPARAAADAILAAAFELELEPADRAPAAGCERLEPGRGRGRGRARGRRGGRRRPAGRHLGLAAAIRDRRAGGRSRRGSGGCELDRDPARRPRPAVDRGARGRRPGTRLPAARLVAQLPPVSAVNASQEGFGSASDSAGNRPEFVHQSQTGSIVSRHEYQATVSMSQLRRRSSSIS